MNIVIIGAGFAGLACAKTLRDFGFDVVVHESAPDVGGVWSATRRYPGLSTQNTKDTYAFSDFPMPDSFPEWPSGAQVQQYLEAYVDHFGLGPALRLGSSVLRATTRSGGGWTITSRPTAGGGVTVTEADHLVVANGIFSTPKMPSWRGAEAFVASGGRVCAASDLTDLEAVRDRHVLVIGYGKSACDVSMPISSAAASTTVVARELLWKMPKKLGNAVNYKFLMLTRLGEALFRYLRPVGVERFLHGPGDPVRRSMLSAVQAVATRQLRLKALGLVPDGSFERIARSTVSLATDGFYSHVAAGRITVLRDTTVTELLVDPDGRRTARLSTGDTVPADVVVCGTGFTQQLPFFDDDLQARLTDRRANFELYRHIQPLTVPDLSFAGYNSSFFSPLSAELASIWIASLLTGRHQLPEPAVRQREVTEMLRWMEERTEGRHARGTNIIPFSMHNIDDLLADLGVRLGVVTRASQWLLPIDPGAYSTIADRVRQRPSTAAGRPVVDPPVDDLPSVLAA
jgi:cation diffusion facilitator CzcD-associated flavoprotein CzcO